MTKLIVVIGVTSNQGGSVARRFSQGPNYHVRGLTRNVSSPATLKLAAQGVEVVSANLDLVESLKTAFVGANIIFSVTNFWEPFFRPDSRQKASEQGISLRRYAYEVEYAQGKNIADAAASPEIFDGLDWNGFIVSTLSHAGKYSQGRFKELYHFDAKADVFPGHVDNKYAATLKTKMSCVQTGYL